LRFWNFFYFGIWIFSYQSLCLSAETLRISAKQFGILDLEFEFFLKGRVGIFKVILFYNQNA
tara:strand:+ start:1478 stop:1663 length:186 start_codon:yes stop_codon:yes gene_type:complete